jgi:transcriptional repressor NrdR
MQCPYCETEDRSRVVDTTRDKEGGIRRRRECQNCGRRFSTYERVVSDMPLLVKTTGEREAFDREKLIRGIQIACAKRPIPAAGINTLVNEIETHLQHMGRDEVSSRVVGDMVIAGLQDLDPIAYIRYAIVYLGLDSLTSVRDMLNSLLANASGSPNSRSPASPAPASAASRKATRKSARAVSGAGKTPAQPRGAEPEPDDTSS